VYAQLTLEDCGHFTLKKVYVAASKTNSNITVQNDIGFVSLLVTATNKVFLIFDYLKLIVVL
jgi:hypothetical protein